MYTRTNTSNNLARPLGSVHYAPRAGTGGVQTLMHIGAADLGGFGPDFSATARTLGWLAVGTWAFAKLGKNDELAQKALPVAAGGFLVSLVL